MPGIHYGVVLIENEWMIISEGLRSGPYPSEADAENTARRMADQAAGLEVQLHIQDKTGRLRLEQQGGDPPALVYDLERFITAQDPVFPTVLAELSAGHKQGHWMWFIFPQLRGLGASRTADFYGLECREEALAYLDHGTLGSRLAAAVEALQSAPARPLHEVLGSPDDLKFCSCMTLFADVAPHGPFRAALDRWCGGQADQRTLSLLGKRV